MHCFPIVHFARGSTRIWVAFLLLLLLDGKDSRFIRNLIAAEFGSGTIVAENKSAPSQQVYKAGAHCQTWGSAARSGVQALPTARQ